MSILAYGILNNRFKDTDELTAADTITGNAGSDTLQLDADAAFTGTIDFEDVTGVTVSITPAATTSKVLIMATLPYVTPTSTRWGAFTILRDTTNLGDATYGLGRINDQTSGSFAAIAAPAFMNVSSLN